MTIDSVIMAATLEIMNAKATAAPVAMTMPTERMPSPTRLLQASFTGALKRAATRAPVWKTRGAKRPPASASEIMIPRSASCPTRGCHDASPPPRPARYVKPTNAASTVV